MVGSTAPQIIGLCRSLGERLAASTGVAIYPETTAGRAEWAADTIADDAQ